MRWTDRVGSDLFRNLIAEECMVVEGAGQAPDAAPAGAADSLAGLHGLSSPLLPPPPGMALGCRPLDPLGQSVLVFQAGRLFLVGPTRAAVDRILSSPGMPRPRHIVIPTWSAAHVDGLQAFFADTLQELIRRNDAGKPGLTIWTSGWIWEELYQRVAGAQNSRSLSAFRYLTSEQVESNLRAGSEPGTPRAVVAFGRDLNLALTAGVKLVAGYVPAALPSLSFRFQCNHLHVDVAPSAGAAIDLAELRKRVIATAPAAVRRMAMVRYGELELQEEPVRYRDAGDGWYAPEPAESWMNPCAVSLAAMGRTIEEIQCAPDTTQPAAQDAVITLPPSAPAGPRGLLGQSVIMILCGGLHRGKDKDAITPARRVNVAPAPETPKLLSVLEWRLQQLETRARAEQVCLPVLLVVSPDTEEYVRSIVARFLEEMPAEADCTPMARHRLRISVIPQMLTPLARLVDGRLAPFEFADGGWSLVSAGHLDSISILHRWCRSEAAAGRNYCVLFPHNNLGNIVSDDTISNLSAFAAGGAAFGFEVFPLIRAHNDNDARWESMSFTTAGSPARLYKIGAYPPVDGSAPEFYSSMTWYVNLERLRAASDRLSDRMICTGASLGQRSGLYRLRQDIDQVTHHTSSGLSCLAMRSAGRPAPGLNAEPRFLVVRNEDHARASEFREAFAQSLQAEPAASGLRGVEVPRQFLILPLAPVRMDYVWGGNEILKRKGVLNSWETRVAETWELSTHPAGPSSVLQTLRRSVLLTDILPRDELRYMAKYLDCQGKLSIQVHPNRVTAAHLDSLNQSLQRSNEKQFELADAWGKEEAFYVLSATSARPNLIFGFDRQKLSPLADILHPVIVRGAAQVTDEKRAECRAFFRELITAMREAVLCHFVNPIGTQLDCRAGLAAACVRAFSANLAEPPRPGDLESILSYHAYDLPRLVGSAGPPLSLFGKEYLFAAIALIRAIQLVSEFAVTELPRSGMHLAEALFKCPAGGWDESLLYRFFYTANVEAGQWVRVPPGMIHAWQGDGNYLIELSDRSDNTFRILDYERELASETRRARHYREAMYSISEESVVTRDSAARLIFPAQTSGNCHRALRYSRIEDESHAAGSWCRVPAIKGYGLLMNPDNPLQVQALGPNGEADCRQLTLTPGGAALVGKNVELHVKRQQANDRLMHIWRREEQENVLCISLASSKIELALWRDRHSPSILWRKLPVSAKDLRRVFTKDIPEALRVWNDAPGRVVVAWPGPIEAEGATLYSTDWGVHSRQEVVDLVQQCLRELAWRTGVPVTIATDVVAGVAGEHYHPLGGLPGSESGLLLNIGSGVGVGFFPHSRGVAPVSAAGRWLYCDIKKGTLGRRPSANGSQPRLGEDVFLEKAPDFDGDWVRASLLFSSAGIALRFLNGLSPDLRQVFLNRCQWEDLPAPASVEAFCVTHRQIASDPSRYDRHRLIAEINAVAAHEYDPHGLRRPARDFIIVVANQLASLVECLPEHLDAAAKASLKRIVLSGSVGEYFGRLRETDLLLDVMKRRLPACDLKRSEIAISCHREITGFLNIGGTK